MAHYPKINFSTHQTTNRDLKLINMFLQDSFEPTVQPRSAAELSKIIKNRLSKNSKTKQQKSSCRQWLANKGINIEPLLSMVAKKRRRHEDQFEIKRSKQDFNKNVMYQPLLLNQEEYIAKAIDFYSNNLKQYVATSRNSRKRLIDELMSRLNSGENSILERNQSYLPVVSRVQPRDLKKRQKYISLMSNLMVAQRQGKEASPSRKRRSDTALNWIQSFADIIEHKVWKVLFEQLKNVNFSSNFQSFIKKMMLNSLKIVQQQFNEELPLNNEGINYYLQHKYLSLFQNQAEYTVDPQHGSLWGKVFLLYRAGRVAEALKLLEQSKQTKVIHSIMATQGCIKQGKPQKQFVANDFQERDIFREQILYALGGERKYSSDAISDPLTLDCVWILLRNTGIFYDTDYEQFKQIRTKMVEYYRNNDFQAQSLYFRIYLLEYDSVVQSGENQILDKDDFVHFLILLSKYPKLFTNSGLVEQRLTQQTISYCLQLIQQDNADYIYYLLQIPHDRFVEEASSIIVSNQLYDKIDWNVFRKYQQEQQFQTFIEFTTRKYVENTFSYLMAAKKIRKLTNAIGISLDLLSEMLIKHITQQKIFDGGEIAEALTDFQKWLGETNWIDKSYHKLLQLFSSERRLSRLLVERNYEQIQLFLGSSKLVVGNIDFHYSKMFQKLVDLKGISVYFIFIRALLKGAQIVLSSKGRLQELRGYRYEMLKNCKNLLQHQKFGVVAKQACAVKLIDDLNSSLFSESDRLIRYF